MGYIWMKELMREKEKEMEKEKLDNPTVRNLWIIYQLPFHFPSSISKHSLKELSSSLTRYLIKSFHTNPFKQKASPRARWQMQSSTHYHWALAFEDCRRPSTKSQNRGRGHTISNIKDNYWFILEGYFLNNFSTSLINIVFLFSVFSMVSARKGHWGTKNKKSHSIEQLGYIFKQGLLAITRKITSVSIKDELIAIWWYFQNGAFSFKC